jgi:hypothetical protein
MWMAKHTKASSMIETIGDGAGGVFDYEDQVISPQAILWLELR